MNENNGIIALFMGATIHPHADKSVWYKGFQDYSHPIHEDALEYHSSWDWLMPVVEKIERMECCDEFRIESEQVIVRADAGPSISSRLYAIKYHNCHANDGTKIYAVYNAVIAFVNWYNNQQTLPTKCHE